MDIHISGAWLESLFIHYVTGVLQRRIHVFDRDFRIRIDDLLAGVASRQHAEDVSHHDASSSNERLTAADAGVNSNTVSHRSPLKTVKTYQSV